MRGNIERMRKDGLNMDDKELLLALLQRECKYLEQNKKKTTYYHLIMELRGILEPVVSGKKSKKSKKKSKKNKRNKSVKKH